MPSLFRMPIQKLKGVGNKKAELFAKLGVDSVGSLLRFYPRAYEDWSMPYTIAEASENTVCCIKVQVEKVYRPVRIRGGKILLKLDVTDGEDYMKVTFFNQQYLYEQLSHGGEFLFYGMVKSNDFGYEMTAPSVMPLTAAGIHPIYPQTAGLSSKQIEAAVHQAMLLLPPVMKDPLPPQLREEYQLCSLDEAIRRIHFPEWMEEAERARYRLAFEEMLTLQLGMARLKSGRREMTTYKLKKDYSEEFFSLLPYRPTTAQLRAVRECIGDMMQHSYPMNRLIQGDVGSGKTAVAAAVCYSAVKNGFQCAFMAPTEILAQQHFRSLDSLLRDKGIRLALLTGSVTAAKKKLMYEQLRQGEIDLVIGTHALLSDEVSFQHLGLVITDEQHRFGVGQRGVLIAKGESPNIMVMSATPIPRTLALMIFGDLDLSVLDELPPGRQKIDTFLIDSGKRERALHFLKKLIDSGRQCYIVCPLVGQSEMEIASAEEYLRMLNDTELKDVRKALLHGKMKPKEKESVMADFAAGEIDILVSTTVIEVGVNVPNAAVMMIENAERFGLSQLHQLRGRVGRGQYRSYCILVSDAQNESTTDRLKVMCSTNDGFQIADEDLRLRGPGDFFGSRQHGLPELKVAGLSDMKMLENTKAAAEKILMEDPELKQEEHRGLAFEISRLFARTGGTRLQ